MIRYLVLARIYYKSISQQNQTRTKYISVTLIKPSVVKMLIILLFTERTEKISSFFFFIKSLTFFSSQTLKLKRRLVLDIEKRTLFFLFY